MTLFYFLGIAYESAKKMTEKKNFLSFSCIYAKKVVTLQANLVICVKIRKSYGSKRFHT